MITQATLLYDSPPTLPQDGMRTDLRMLAGRHGLPVSGDSEVDECQLRLSVRPYEIVIQVNKNALAASSFAGALSANLRSTQRGPLSKRVADHAAHVVVSVRDTGESQDAREAILPTAQVGLQDARRGTIFAQDVTKTVMRHMTPLAVHWHPSNQLALPGGLTDAEAGRLYLPICLRLRCTSAALQGTAVVNMAQEVEGAEAFLGRPLHVMTLSLNRFETMQLAVAFLDRMLEGEARPIGGAVFRDQRGTRVQVVEQKPTDERPDGLIALVELDAAGEKPATEASGVAQARDQVARRVRSSRILSRDLKKSPKPKDKVVPTSAQMVAVQNALKAEEAKANSDAKISEADALPSVEQLKRIRAGKVSRTK